jgi:hypothetical protein
MDRHVTMNSRLLGGSSRFSVTCFEAKSSISAACFSSSPSSSSASSSTFFRVYWRLTNQLVGALPPPTGLECEREILQEK